MSALPPFGQVHPLPVNSALSNARAHPFTTPCVLFARATKASRAKGESRGCYRDNVDIGIVIEWPPNEPEGAPFPPPVLRNSAKLAKLLPISRRSPDSRHSALSIFPEIRSPATRETRIPFRADSASREKIEPRGPNGQCR